MTDLVPKDEADLEKRREAQTQRLQSLREDLPARVKTEPEKVISDLYRTEALRGIAAKLRIDEIQREAMLTIIEMKRQMAKQYSPGRGRRNQITLESLDIADKTAERWRKMARLPEKFYKRAVAGQHIPSEASILSEAGRYLKIKQLVVEEKEAATVAGFLDDFMKRGMSPHQVKEELGLVKVEDPFEATTAKAKKEDADVKIDYDEDDMEQIRTFVKNGDRALKMVEDLKIILAPMEMTKEILGLVRDGTRRFAEVRKQLNVLYVKTKDRYLKIKEKAK